MDASGRGRWKTAAISMLVGVTALLAVLPSARSNALWQDEVASARILVRPAAAALRRVAGTESTPPVWYALGWLLRRLGLAVTDVRLLSVACGAALAALVVAYASRLLPLLLAGLSGLLVALGAEPVRHGWELRGYALFGLTALLFVVALERAAAAPVRRRLAVLAAITATGSLTHYFFLFTVLAGVLWLVVTPELRTVRGSVLAACGAGLVPLAAWSPAALVQVRHDAYSWIGSFDPDVVAQAYLRLFRTPVPGGLEGTVWGLVVIAVVGVGALRLWRASAAGRLCVLAAVIPVAATAALWLAGAHVFTTRNLLGAAPFAAVTAAAAITTLPGRAVVPAALAVAVVAGAGYASAREGTPPYDEVANALVRQGWTRERPIAILGPPFAYLYPLSWYLPNADDLQLATDRWIPSCGPIHIVSARGLFARNAKTARVGRIVVARMERPGTIAAELRRANGRVAVTKDLARDCRQAGPGRDRSAAEGSTVPRRERVLVSG